MTEEERNQHTAEAHTRAEVGHVAETPTGALPNEHSKGPLGEERKSRFKERSELANLWIQSVAIVLAGGWALWAFVYAEYKVSKRPAHISPTLSLELADPGIAHSRQDQVGIPIKVTIGVHNTSEKPVRIGSSFVVAWGYRMEALPACDLLKKSEHLQACDFTGFVREYFTDRTNTMVEKYYQSKNVDAVFAGEFFVNAVFEEDEESSVEAVFAVPDNKFDTVEAVLCFLVSDVDARMKTEWRIDDAVAADGCTTFDFEVYEYVGAETNDLLVRNDNPNDWQLREYGSREFIGFLPRSRLSVYETNAMSTLR